MSTRAKLPILVVRSFQGKPCHCCGTTENVWFLRFRQGRIRSDNPSEVYLRLCDECIDLLSTQLRDRHSHGKEKEVSPLDSDARGQGKASQAVQAGSRPAPRSFGRHNRRKGDTRD